MSACQPDPKKVIFYDPLTIKSRKIGVRYFSYSKSCHRALTNIIIFINVMIINIMANSISYLQSAVTHDCEGMSQLCGFIPITCYLWHLLVMQQNRSDISNMALCDINHSYGYVPNQYGAAQHNSINFHYLI